MAHRPKPFRSKAQWRFFFANPRLRRFARRKAHATPSYRALPRRKGPRKR